MRNNWEGNNDNELEESMEENSRPFNNQKKSGNSDASRARNKTVMLTPEMTGMMRAKMKSESAGQLPYAPIDNPNPEIEDEHNDHPPVANEEAAKSGKSRSARDLSRSGNEEGMAYTKLTPIVGFLISFDNDVNGEVHELRIGRIIVSSEKNPSGNCLYLKHETVSPMHAVIRVGQNGDVQILDQLSEYGTKIKRANPVSQDIVDEIELSGEKSSIQHKDVLSFGDRKFVVSLF